MPESQELLNENPSAKYETLPHELLAKEAPEASKTIQALAIPLGYLPELVGDKTLKIT